MRHEYLLRSDSEAKLLVEGTYATKAAREAALKPLGLRPVRVRSFHNHLDYRSNKMRNRTHSGRSKTPMSTRPSHLIVYTRTTWVYFQSICSPCGNAKSKMPAILPQLQLIRSEYHFLLETYLYRTEAS